MRIAILGAGFTGLTAALRLLQAGHEVTILEKEDNVGGLAGGFKLPNWEWTLEKSYHHWFTNDSSVLNLCRELGQRVIIKKPLTTVFVRGKILPLDSPTSLLFFPHLPVKDRIRTGFCIFYLKYLSDQSYLSDKKALPWIRKYMGKASAKLIWEPLFLGKFGRYAEEVALTWFWARIKKRTASLAYPESGFQSFADRIVQSIEKLGGKIYLGTEVRSIKNTSFVTHRRCYKFDKIIVTLPTPVFTQITPDLPSDYVQKASSIPHLHALNLILVLNKPFLKKEYWLNITDKNFPFLVLAEHTNFMDPKYYGNQHIVYLGNYLPDGHPYLKLSTKELFKVFKPFLQKINPSLPLSPLSSHLFTQLFAQPVVRVDYPNLIPTFQTPLKNIYLANLDMVYPWDRGTNYAIELGEKVAALIK